MTTQDLSDLLQAHPLPAVSGDKDDRGTAVIVAGAPTCPGAAVLTATAILRAGAGRVQIVTHPDLTTAIGLALPETYVTGWDLHAPLPASVVDLVAAATAVLIGPGLDDDAADAAVTVTQHIAPDTTLLLDARALPAAARVADRHPLVLPNLSEARELAELLELGEDLDPRSLGERLATTLGTAVAIRAEETIVVAERTWSSRGHAGLGTAGSGDVLIGIATGLAARGLPGLQAIGWAVAAHTAAGELLGRDRSNPGYLARELLDAIPTAIDQLGSAGCPTSVRRS